MLNEKKKTDRSVEDDVQQMYFFLLFIRVQMPPCFEIYVKQFMNFTDFKKYLNTKKKVHIPRCEQFDEI